MASTPNAPDLRAHQISRIMACPLKTWPESRLEITELHGELVGMQESGVGVVEKLIQDTNDDMNRHEYGTRHLSVYRNLRDLLYGVGEQPRLAARVRGSNSSHDPGSCWCQKCVHDFLADNRTLVDKLWERLQVRRAYTSPLPNPLVFPPGEESHSLDATAYSLHNNITAELAQGYDSCVTQAEEALTSAWIQPKVGVDIGAEQRDMMALLGTKLANWCTLYTPGPGTEQRWAVYAMEDDEGFSGWLARLQPRRECHLKDALMFGLSTRQVVETVLLPMAGMGCDSPSGGGVTGVKGYGLTHCYYP